MSKWCFRSVDLIYLLTILIQNLINLSFLSLSLLNFHTNYIGHEVFRVEVHPRKEFRLEAVDNSLSDINYFRFEEINNSTVAIKLAQSLEDLVDKVSVIRYYYYSRFWKVWTFLELFLEI